VNKKFRRLWYSLFTGRVLVRSGDEQMIVAHAYPTGPRHSIELGQSTWDINERSIRSRYETATGGFNRAGSTEVPLEDLRLMIEHGARHGYWSPAECASMIEALAASIKQQCP
jgi:hypothetical protein